MLYSTDRLTNEHRRRRIAKLHNRLSACARQELASVTSNDASRGRRRGRGFVVDDRCDSLRTSKRAHLMPSSKTRSTAQVHFTAAQIHCIVTGMQQYKGGMNAVLTALDWTHLDWHGLLGPGPSGPFVRPYYDMELMQLAGHYSNAQVWTQSSSDPVSQRSPSPGLLV